MSTPSFQTYLASCRDLLADSSAKTIVIGNEAADLDSMASSLAYAYFLASENQQSDQHYIPVMPIPRADFKLRTEAVYVSNKAGINLKEVIFFDEIDLAAIMAANGKLVLVDHNKLAVNLDFSEKVVAILDHHVDENLYQTAQPRIIEMVGSTATLVSQEINKNDSALLDKKIATLLLGTILLDTVNLVPEAGRVTPADNEAAQLLLPIFAADQHHFFNTVQEEKFNVESLSTTDLLRKDYKQWQLGEAACGIGSVLMPVKKWTKRDPDLAKAFVDFAIERGLEVLLAMNAYTDPDFKRDLVIYATNQEMHDTLLNEMQAKGLELNTIVTAEINEPSFGIISYYSQGNLAISRKKLHPILSDLLG